MESTVAPNSPVVPPPLHRLPSTLGACCSPPFDPSDPLESVAGTLLSFSLSLPLLLSLFLFLSLFPSLFLSFFLSFLLFFFVSLFLARPLSFTLYSLTTVLTISLDSSLSSLSLSLRFRLLPFSLFPSRPIRTRRIRRNDRKLTGARVSTDGFEFFSFFSTFVFFFLSSFFLSLFLFLVTYRSTTIIAIITLLPLRSYISRLLRLLSSLSFLLSLPVSFFDRPRSITAIRRSFYSPMVRFLSLERRS